MNLKFEFNGDWETEINLQKLTFLNDINLLEYRRDVKDKLDIGFVDLSISDNLNLSADPTKEQFETILFIQTNEEVLLETIFEHVKNVIYPYMKTQIDDRENWFPLMAKKEDLKKCLGLTSIQILDLNKDNYSYFSMNFEASWDNEHGFNILFHKNRIVGIGEAGGYDIFKIYEECKLNSNDEIYKFNHWNDNIYDFFEPNIKYQKLTPLQISSNTSLPYRLIRNGQTVKLYNYIKKGLINIDYSACSTTMLSMAIQVESLEIVKYLIQNKISNVFGIEQDLQKVKNEEIKRIVEEYLSTKKN